MFFDNKYLDEISWNNLWSGGVKIIENEGHAPFWAQPEAFNDVLEQFLNDVNCR